MGRHRRGLRGRPVRRRTGPSGTTGSGTPPGTSGAALDGIRDLGYRLSGSSDLFAPARRPWASINFVTAHDGFTLRDLVSYDHKHNEANGEDNRDGTDHNRSWNYGAEGETDDPAIIALRTRQARNIAATLLLSTGTPMITMGDELWRTQGGNNNAYCQDNEISWVDWRLCGAGRTQEHAGVLPAHPGDPQRGPGAAAGRVLRRPRPPAAATASRTWSGSTRGATR